MEIFLFTVIVLQLGYLFYSDIQNRKERELLERKIMSGTIDNYMASMEEAQKESLVEEEDPYIPADEAGIEQIVDSKDIL